MSAEAGCVGSVESPGRPATAEGPAGSCAGTGAFIVMIDGWIGLVATAVSRTLVARSRSRASRALRAIAAAVAAIAIATITADATTPRRRQSGRCGAMPG